MSAKSFIKIVNLQFIPDLVELPTGGEIEIKVLSHQDTALYSSSQRKFIISSSEFETPELFPGDSFKWKFKHPGRYVLRCPLYSWMKSTVIISASENPQDPDMFLHKPAAKKSFRTVSTQIKAKTKLEPPSIGSSIGSEDETKEAPIEVDETLDKEIEMLFLQVKEECEKDQVTPANFLQEIEEEVSFETREKVTRNKDVVNVEREEKKGKVVFVTRTMAPVRYFPEYQPKKASKSISKLKKREKNFRKKLKTNKELCKNLLRVIVSIKVNVDQRRIWDAKAMKGQTSSVIERKKKDLDKTKAELQEEFEKLKTGISESQMKKVEEFWDNYVEDSSELLEEYAQRKIASKLFGFAQLWWAEEIFYPKESLPAPIYASDLNAKSIERFLMDRIFYSGWSEFN